MYFDRVELLPILVALLRNVRDYITSFQSSKMTYTRLESLTFLGQDAKLLPTVEDLPDVLLHVLCDDVQLRLDLAQLVLTLHCMSTLQRLVTITEQLSERPA